MSVPGYQSLMLPILKRVDDGQPHAFGTVRDALAQQLQLSEDDLSLLLPSGKQTLFSNRCGWAKTYLYKAGLLDCPARSVIQLTPLGKATLASGIAHLSAAYLRRFSSFNAFIGADGGEAQGNNGQVAVAIVPAEIEVAQQTPDEVIDETYTQLRRDVEEELLEQIKSGTPQFFEQLVIDLLLKMGYGGSREDAGEALGRSGDGGIDGIIKEDRLGLDAIYVQAKRWQSTVGRPDIQGFAGSLHGVRARKGVFITTSQYSAEAKAYVCNIDLKIVLIDGKSLVKLMFDYGLGVSTVKSYEVKKIDSDYFAEAQ